MGQRNSKALKKGERAFESFFWKRGRIKESEGTRVMRVESQGKFLLPTKLSVNLEANHPHATHEEGVIDL